MTERVQQQICIKFSIKLEHSSTETIAMIQKAAAVGNWWLAALSYQCARSCITSCAVFWWNIKPPRWLRTLQSRFGALWLLAFPKTKITLERKEISDGRLDWFSLIWENMTGQPMAIGRTVWGPKVLLWRRLRHHCPMYYVSCILYILQQMSQFFILHGWMPSGHTFAMYILARSAKRA